MDTQKESISDISDSSILLIGAGEMTEQILIELSKHKLKQIFIFNRTYSKAWKLAYRHSAVPVESIDRILEKIDILVSSTASDTYILNKDQVMKAMSVRKKRPLFMIDISIPRDIDPAVQVMENLTLYNLNNLGKIAEEIHAVLLLVDNPGRTAVPLP